MEAGDGAVMACPLGHDTDTKIVLKAVRQVRQQEAGHDTGIAVAEGEDVPSPEHTQVIEDRYISGNPVGSFVSSKGNPECVQVPPDANEILPRLSAVEQETNTPTLDDVDASGPLTGLIGPRPQSSNVADIPYQADALTLIRRKPSPSITHSKLTAVIEHKPPTHHRTNLPLEETFSTINIAETDEIVARHDTVTSTSKMPLHLPSSRASSMCSAVSARSHQEPGPIHISPSAQLQSMQSISRLDARLNEVMTPHESWTRFQSGRIHNQAAYIPTGTPESITNIPLRADILEAHSRLNSSILYQYADGVNKHEWARSSEWVEPCAIEDGPKKWIEDFLTRQEQADRDEDSERQRQEKQDKKYGGIRYRVNSADKFRRKLSKKRVSRERASFEARQERQIGTSLNPDLEPSAYGKTLISLPGENLERPERTRAFSWTAETYQSLTSPAALPDRPSASPRLSTSASPFPLHRTHTADRVHISLPSQHPSKRTFSNSSFAPSHHRSTSALRRVVTRRHSDNHLRIRSWENLRVKRITSMGSGLKRTFSTGFIPVITEGKDSVKGLVGRVERVGESVTRKLSASWKGKWKGLGKKKKNMNVGGLYIIGREY